MPVVPRHTQENGHSGLSAPITAAVCVVSVVVALMLCVLTWKFIVWKRDKGAPATPSLTKSQLSPTAVAHLPQKPELTHPTDPGKGRNFNDQTSGSNPPPPAYKLGPRGGSPASGKKPTPALHLDVSCDSEAKLPSPLRSSSFNPKTQSLTSRISARMSMGSKKLPRLVSVAALYFPSLSDELPIKLGETLRMIAEYEDEWCLVQRVGRTDERGVVPRFCLVERQEVTPSSGKRATGGPFQTSTFRK